MTGPARNSIIPRTRHKCVSNPQSKNNQDRTNRIGQLNMIPSCIHLAFEKLQRSHCCNQGWFRPVMQSSVFQSWSVLDDLGVVVYSSSAVFWWHTIQHNLGARNFGVLNSSASGAGHTSCDFQFGQQQLRRHRRLQRIRGTSGRRRKQLEMDH